MSGLRVSAKLRLAYLTALFRQPVSVIDQASPGKIASRLTTNSNTIQKAISQQLAQLIQAIALTLGLYVTAFVKGALLTLVASSSIPLTIIIYSIAIPHAFGTQRKAEKIREQASALAFEVLESIRIVAAFGAEERLGTTHNDFLEKAKVLEKKNGVWTGFFFAPMFFSTYATFALTFWFGIKQVTAGHLAGIGSVVVYVLEEMRSKALIYSAFCFL
jgi:ATP-binding cassette subfamily B (MDR/TAP) protein 1